MAEIQGSYLKEMINKKTEEINAELARMTAATSFSVPDMFGMQMKMNAFNQLSEMSTSAMSAVHTAASSIARNLKA